MEGIGSKIRQLRKEKGLTLNEVAEKTGLSQGFLSQLERSKSSVTLQSISKISDALEVSRTYFFENDTREDSDTSETATERNVNLQRSNFFYQSLKGNITNPIFEPMLAVLLPDENRVQPSNHSGQEFVYVLEGELTLIIEDETRVLKVGDNFHITSSMAHTWFNNTKDVVKLIYVFSNVQTYY